MRTLNLVEVEAQVAKAQAAKAPKAVYQTQVTSDHWEKATESQHFNATHRTLVSHRSGKVLIACLWELKSRWGGESYFVRDCRLVVKTPSVVPVELMQIYAEGFLAGVDNKLCR